MKAYHFLDVATLSFTSDNQEISSHQQQQLDMNEDDNEPISSISLTNHNFYKGFDKLKCLHEVTKRKAGRAYGSDKQFDSYVGRSTFNAYLNRDLNLMLACASRPNVNGLIRRLKGNNSSIFDIRRYTVDFSRIIEVVSNVKGSWISELPDTNVRSVGLFGNHVDLSDDFSRHRAVGSLSALNVVLALDNEDVNFMITRNCSIVLYRDQSIEEEIDLAIALWKILKDNNAVSLDI